MVQEVYNLNQDHSRGKLTLPQCQLPCSVAPPLSFILKWTPIRSTCKIRPTTNLILAMSCSEMRHQCDDLSRLSAGYSGMFPPTWAQAPWPRITKTWRTWVCIYRYVQQTHCSETESIQQNTPAVLLSDRRSISMHNDHNKLPTSVLLAWYILPCVPFRQGTLSCFACPCVTIPFVTVTQHFCLVDSHGLASQFVHLDPVLPRPSRFFWGFSGPWHNWSSQELLRLPLFPSRKKKYFLTLKGPVKS